MGVEIFVSRSSEDVVLTPDDDAALRGLDLHLSEWVGTGSFAARRYVELVARVTGVVFGYKWISPEEVVGMAAAFEERDPEDIAAEARDDTYPATVRVVRDLRRLLRVCANRGLGLLGM